MPVDYVFPLKMDWLFFSSKRGVHFFLQESKHKELLAEAIAQGLKLAAIGPVTGNYLEAVFGVKCDFVGSSKNVHLSATTFLSKAKGQRVVFPQGIRSQQSIQKIVGEDLFIQDLIVYKNTPIYEEISTPDIAVFTSPLNVEAFINKNQLSNINQVIAIGQTTKQALIKAGRMPDKMPFAFDELHLSMVCY